MSTNSEALSEVASKAGHGAEAKTTQKVADAAHNVIDETAAKAQSVEKQIRERAVQAGEKVEATQEAASRKIESTITKAEAFAKEQPIAAAGIAFAAGVLAISLLRR